jgi:SAM-dependent methyltransferase
LARNGAKVTLLDASQAGLDQARVRFGRIGCPAQFVNADMFAYPSAAEKKYDVSLSSGVIEHFRGGRRTEAIAAHCRVLKPGGLAIISVPHAWCVPYRLWKSYLEVRGWWPYGQEIPYAASEMRRRARAAGFGQVETVCSGFWHSLGAHWGRSLLGRNVDWSARRSIWDSAMGFTILLFARKSVG